MAPGSPPQPPRDRDVDAYEADYDDAMLPESHLLDYVRKVYRRRWLVVTILVAVTAYAGVKSFTTTPVFEATSLLLIETQDRNVLTFEDIVQQDRNGKTLRRWSLSNAWPTKFVAGEWDNEADENVIESLTLTYDFFDLR